MKQIEIAASRPYCVQIAPGLLETAGAEIAKKIAPCRAVLVTDDIVQALYADRVQASLERAGFSVRQFVFAHGEASKTLQTYASLLQFLSEQAISRSDLLVALGGGVVGDLTGFAAATYQRGIAFVQIPTTLLAAVDASVGGKTAVDLPGGKNQVGCFYSPIAVLCDPAVFASLPPREYRCGCAEIIKYGMIGDAALLQQLVDQPVCAQWEPVLVRCICMKRDLVQQDEFDRGCRQLLNFGHTIGHAIERCSGFAVAHGEAVAAGMAIMTRAAVKMGICPPETWPQLQALLQRYGLPEETTYSQAQLCEAAAADKKRMGETICLVLPEDYGRCRLETVAFQKLWSYLQAGGVR